MKNHAKLVGQTIDEQETKLTFKDTILYALSLGYGENPDQEEHLKYVYEEDLHTLPGISMVLAYPGFWMQSPEYGFDWRQVLHAEESFKIHQEIPAEANLYGKTTIEKVVDRGKNKGCFVYSRKELFLDDKKTLLATVISNTLARGDGGFSGDNGNSGEKSVAKAIPDRKADFSDRVTTMPQSALIYRLCGDLNPLHADPAIAKIGGFSAPILHGRCTMGIAMRSIIKSVCSDDAVKLKSMQVRFSAPFYPGETLQTEIWDHEGELLFKSTCVNRDLVVLSNGVATID